MSLRFRRLFGIIALAQLLEDIDVLPHTVLALGGQREPVPANLGDDINGIAAVVRRRISHDKGLIAGVDFCLKGYHDVLVERSNDRGGGRLLQHPKKSAKDFEISVVWEHLHKLPDNGIKLAEERHEVHIV